MREDALRVFDIEAKAILKLKERIDGSFIQAVDYIKGCPGKLIVTGIGKSGHIARKISSTFSSTGTSSFFLHPAESIHGDLGVITSNDVVMAISYGGEGPELDFLIQYLSRKGIPLIVMTGKPLSSLGKAATVVLNIGVDEEACPLGLAPTASSTASLAMGDALAMVVLKEKGFSEKDFAEFHPGGSLGRKLLTRVKDLMHVGQALPLISEETELREVLSLMTAKEVRGVVGVVDHRESLKGIIVDGDIRRYFEKNTDLTIKAKMLMSKNPKVIDCSELAEKALLMLEQYRILVMFATDRAASNPNKPVGLIHLHDLLQAKIR